MSRTGLLVTVCPMTHPFLPIAAGLLVLFSWTGSAHANADRADVEPDVAPPASKPVAWKLSSLQGRSEAGAPRVSGNGLSVGWDYRDFFLKFTHDARANFTPANMNRLVTGFRF